jgi:hypothetical protein
MSRKCGPRIIGTELSPEEFWRIHRSSLESRPRWVAKNQTFQGYRSGKGHDGKVDPSNAQSGQSSEQTDNHGHESTEQGAEGEGDVMYIGNLGKHKARNTGKGHLHE